MTGILIIIGMIIGLFFIIGIIFFLIVRKSNNKANSNPPQHISMQEVSQEEKLPYAKKYLLTKNEWYFYKSLKTICDKYNLHILSKVRMADIIEVTEKAEYMRYFGKIQSKHIDFILADSSNLAIKLLIELDDSSHNSEKGKMRDEFVDKIYMKVGYPILHLQNDFDLEAKITEALNIETKKSPDLN